MCQPINFTAVLVMGMAASFDAGAEVLSKARSSQHMTEKPHWALRIVENPYFDYVLIAFLLGNALTFGIEADIMARQSLIRADYSGEQAWVEAFVMAEMPILVALHARTDGQQGAKSLARAIAASARNNSWDSANDLLSMMRAKRISPNVFSCTSAVNACEKCHCWTVALEIFGHMQLATVSPSLFTFTSTISTCGKGRRWQVALVLFGQIAGSSRLDVVTQNAAISANEKGEQWDRALGLFSHVLSADQPNLVTYNSAISASEKAGCWQIAVQLLPQAARNRLQPDTITFNSAISACEKAGQWLVALYLFSSMSGVCVQPDLVSCNGALSACAKASEWELAVHLLSGMLALRTSPDVISCSSVISACESKGRWQVAIAILAGMLTCRVMPNSISFNSAISACARGHRWEMALCLLHQMPIDSRDVISFSSAVSSCEKAAHWELAIRLQQEMKCQAVSPNVVTYNSLISTCDKAGRWEAALQLLAEMPRNKQLPNTISYNSAISACARRGRWQIALGLLQELSSCGCPDQVSYNGVISACEMLGGWQTALQLLSQMRADLSPNVISYNSVISAAEKAQCWQVAVDLLATMPEGQVLPNEITYNSTISACAIGGHWQAAVQLFTDMSNISAVSMSPDVLTYGSTLAACTRAQAVKQACNLISQMPVALTERNAMNWKRSSKGFQTKNFNAADCGIHSVGKVFVAAHVKQQKHTKLQLATPLWHPGSENVAFTMIFVAELAIRIVAYHWNFLFGEGWMWNLFDLIIVFFSVVDEVSQLFLSGSDVQTLLGFAGVLRMLRLGRVMRLIRLVRVVPALKSMVYLVSASMNSFFWTGVLLLLLMYCVAVYFTDLATEATRLNANTSVDLTEVRRYWGSLGQAVASLFQAITGGMDWRVFVEVFETALPESHDMLLVVFSLYIAFATLVMLNLVTGVFVEGAQRIAKEEKEQELIKSVQKLCVLADTSGDWEITWEEFEANLSSQEMITYLKAFDMDSSQARDIFYVLDTNDSGTVSLEDCQLCSVFVRFGL
eukprot:s2_g25.t1